MMFIPIKMSVRLEDGRTVVFDLSKQPELEISSDSPLTPEEEATLALKFGAFIGGGNAALSQLKG